MVGEKGNHVHGSEYFRRKFYGSRLTEGKQICHITCCTDIDFMKKIISSLMLIIIDF